MVHKAKAKFVEKKHLHLQVFLGNVKHTIL